jgi:NADP-dependent 3-hydroxy acid dehydrogenase YdfG
MSAERPVALVTGATRGVGAAVAEALAPKYDMLLGGRDQQALSEIACRLPSAHPWPVDLGDLDALAAVIPDIRRLDVLVHSAGLWEPGLMSDTTPETWHRLFTVNVFAVAELSRLLLPALRAAQGSVILINSTAALQAGSGRGAYAASKVALRAFAESLHAEELQNGVRVTSVYLGRVATDMQRAVRQHEGGRFEADKYLTPQSVAAAILNLVTAPPDSHVTEFVLRPRVKPVSVDQPARVDC